MTESSFPVVGVDFTAAEWSQALSGLGKGVLDDWGSPYAITLNTNDTATIAVSTVSGVARAVVAGFGHLLTARVTLSIPAVSSTTTYNIGLLYDPGQATTPVLLKVVAGTVTLTPGQVWLPLYVIVRQASQALTSAALSSPMLKVQPQASVSSEAALLAQKPQTYLAGTTVYCLDTGRTFRATVAGAKWVACDPVTVTGKVVTSAAIAAGTSANFSITFPSGVFTTPPMVFVIPANARFTPALISVTTSGASIGLGNWSGAAGIPGAFYWLAIQA